MKRREFITLVGGAAAWPISARSQMPTIGFLGSASAVPSTKLITAFRQGLQDSGYVEGRNVTVEYRWADNHYDRLPTLAAELVRLSVNVMVASGGPAAALAAKAATSTIPTVFTATSDPVKLGLVSSLNHPGGNVTGSAMFTSELDAKRLELLRELVPTSRIVGVLINPARPNAEAQSRDVQQAGNVLGLRVTVVSASSEGDIDAAFAGLVGQSIGTLLVGADPLFNNQRQQLVTLAARHGIPAIYMAREFVEDGGLASYGSNIGEGYRQAGNYAGQILKGAKPANLPVVQPTKVELVINLKAAKKLGLDVSLPLQQRADEVIE